MDKQQDFQNWEETVRHWNKLDNVINTLPSSGNKTIRPNMYKISILYNEKIPNEVYFQIFTKYFFTPRYNLISNVKTLKVHREVTYGYFTKEVAEDKVNSILNFTHKSSFQLKCIITKDDEYAFKKS